MTSRNISALCVVLLASNFVLAGQRLVSKPSQFPGAAAASCEGRYVGADCTVEFEGGYVSFGVCVEVPNSGGELTCQIDVTELPQNCQNNALGTNGSYLTFGGLAAILFWFNRRGRATNNAL